LKVFVTYTRYKPKKIIIKLIGKQSILEKKIITISCGFSQITSCKPFHQTVSGSGGERDERAQQLDHAVRLREH
jgi:hypothetical protein